MLNPNGDLQLRLQQQLQQRVEQQISTIYADINLSVSIEVLAAELISTMRLTDQFHTPTPQINHWSEKDTILITYGDSILNQDEKPLQTLHHFLQSYCADTINSVHILPFFPYSSDDGFSVIDYASVNDALGDWDDIKQIAQSHHLMSDLVINHCSSRSKWFDNFIRGEGTGYDYFYTASTYSLSNATVSANGDSSTDRNGIETVVRPRTSPLFRNTKTASGEQQVWCTFSHDQVDLDFTNPKVLINFVSIIRQYLDNGVKIFRLDAIAFLWKKAGTPCINLPETHEMVRLLRTLIEHARPDAVIITETNIPNKENLTYFGNGNEAHCIYNFALPPLLVNTLITGNCQYLKQWMMSMPPAQNGTAYFNFIASHDGIGLRPTEGLLSDQEINQLVTTMQEFGGKISWRTVTADTKNTANSKSEEERKPYELNITLYDALKGTTAGKDEWGHARFICAHTIMLALEGIPGIYIHSLLGTSNDYKKCEHTSHNRSINRHRWSLNSLTEQLNTPESQHARSLHDINHLITLRTAQPAFHPNATQFTLQLGEQLFGFWRQSIDRRQSIFCISNISNTQLTLPLANVNLISSDFWYDLITGDTIEDISQILTLKPYQTLWLSNR
ncbi:alpha-amylase [Moritella sp. JT01]|uniref:sugar phosphorylase n=1 Tax=Moritella sp. JT01 TaxID=756698 RepID=UPI000792550A|nr:sugar phosphorylase [Moritella sp. JT01]KXO09207.1 alpha-amylase [Moritella sp. JT01]